MQVKTEIARAMEESEQPRLDSAAKRILSNKYILAWIMSACVREYKGLDINEIAERYIEGEPKVASAPVHRDESGEPSLPENRAEEHAHKGSGGPKNERIYGLDTADKSRTEHTTLYDVLFYAVLPGSEEKIGMFINVEAQSEYYLKYPLVKRGIYYCSRLISAQFQRDFADGQYRDLKKVYSIWICADVPDKLDNTITRYSLTEEQILGQAEEERKNYDLMNVVMVRFNDNRILTAIPENSNEQGNELNRIRTGDVSEDMIRLLRLLFTSKNGRDEKKQILQEEYNIPMTRELEEEVENMCNLSQGISAKSFQQGMEKGLEKGLEKGMEKGVLQVAVELLKMKLPVSNIVVATKLTLEQLHKIAQENGLELVME